MAVNPHGYWVSLCSSPFCSPVCSPALFCLPLIFEFEQGHVDAGLQQCNANPLCKPQTNANQFKKICKPGNSGVRITLDGTPPGEDPPKFQGGSKGRRFALTIWHRGSCLPPNWCDRFSSCGQPQCLRHGPAAQAMPCHQPSAISHHPCATSAGLAIGQRSGLAPGEGSGYRPAGQPRSLRHQCRPCHRPATSHRSTAQAKPAA